MKSKLALLLATLLFFNIILPVRVSAASVQDQSKPIFGLTADQVVEKYNQLTDQQKDQVLRSLGNTSIFANSLFGNIFNSTFGALDDAIEKIGDLFFQANGVIYKLGSSALAWVSRLIDKVFNNDLNDLNISQPVIDDLYLYTRGLVYKQAPLFVQPNYPSFIPSVSWGFIFPLPDSHVEFYAFPKNFYYSNYTLVLLNTHVYNPSDLRFCGLTVDLDSGEIYQSYLECVRNNLNQLVINHKYKNTIFTNYIRLNDNGTVNENWQSTSRLNGISSVPFNVSFSNNDYLPSLLNILNTYYVYCSSYFVIHNNILTEVFLETSPTDYNISNNTYYNYIYNIPVETPLNVTNIVSNTAINYNPIDNIAYYLPDQYDIEQNFTVVNNYYISSGSAISGQAIDVNLVSPGVIDVRITNPEDISQEVTNNISKDLILNFDIDYGDLILEPKLEVNLNQGINSIKPEITSSGSIVTGFAGGIPPDLFKIVCVLFGISLIVACLYHGSN